MEEKFKKLVESIKILLKDGIRRESLFDDVFYHTPNIQAVSLVYNNKRYYNFIDEDNEILSEEWFDFVHWFTEGYALVMKFIDDEDKAIYNLIDTHGKLVSEEWSYSIPTRKKCFTFTNSNGEEREIWI